VEREGESFTKIAYELLKNMYKEIFLDIPRDYFPIFSVEKQHKNKQSLKQNKIVET
jgi:hypothetical protein